MKKLIAIILLILVLFSMTGCASLKRMTVDWKSEMQNGLDRTINVYTANGELLATYTGKIDIAANDGGYFIRRTKR